MQRVRIISASRACVKILPGFVILLVTVFVYRKFKSLVFNISENSSDRLYEAASSAIRESEKLVGEIFTSIMKSRGSYSLGIEEALAMLAFFLIIVSIPVFFGGLIFFLWLIIEVLDIAFSHWVGQLIMGIGIILIIVLPLREVLVTWYKKFNRRTSYEKELINKILHDLFQDNQVTSSRDVCELITKFVDQD